MREAWFLPLIVAMSLSVAPAPAFAETIQVTIDKLVFTPADISVRVGDTVEWINKDVIAHTATVKGGWDVMIPAKASARMVVQKAESVEYYCRFHPNMKGRLTASAH